MARITYGVVAGALVTLVTGFFIRTSAIPLYLSIAFSLAVIGLITTGWARRLRSEGGSFDEVEVEEIDPDTMFVEVTDSSGEMTAQLPSLRRTAKSKREKTKGKAPKTKTPKAKVPKTKARKAKPRGGRPTAKQTKRKRAGSKKSSGKRVLVITGRDRYHRASCRFVSGLRAQRIPLETARRRGYGPCSACSPN